MLGTGASKTILILEGRQGLVAATSVHHDAADRSLPPRARGQGAGYIYIYIYRERERERERYTYIKYIHKYIYIERERERENTYTQRHINGVVSKKQKCYFWFWRDKAALLIRPGLTRPVSHYIIMGLASAITIIIFRNKKELVTFNKHLTLTHYGRNLPSSYYFLFLFLVPPKEEVTIITESLRQAAREPRVLYMYIYIYM